MSLLNLKSITANESPPWRRGLLGLGSFSGGQPPKGLLGPYYDPVEERRQKIFGAMTQAGIQLLTNGRGSFGEVLGQGLAGAAQGAQQAGQDYRQDAFGYQQLAQQQSDRQRQIENDQFNRNRLIKQDAWTNTEHQQILEDRAAAERLKTNQHSAIMDWANKKETEQPGFLKWAEQFPDEAAKVYAAEMMPPGGEGFTLGEGQDRYDATGRKIASGAPKTVMPTDDEREYLRAKSEGYKGTFPEYMIEMKKAGATNLNLGAPIPAEIGARIGLGERFLSTDYPDTMEKIQSGNATGPIDYIMGALGRGDAGEVQRRMATGVDSLRRNLTGAGIGVSEANDYATRYLPKWSDDADTLERKALGLKADLEAVAQGALAGKNGTLGSLLRGQQGWGETIDKGMKNQAAPSQGGSKVIDGYTIRRVQ